MTVELSKLEYNPNTKIWTAYNEKNEPTAQAESSDKAWALAKAS